MSFTCPACQRTSHHPKDEEHGWCSACSAYTGGHVFITDETGTWCRNDCPRPEVECGALAIQMNP